MQDFGRSLVTFEYGHCPDRMPLKAIGVVDATKKYKGRQYWHIQPVRWEQGSPLPRWIEANPAAVLSNSEALTITAKAS